MSSYNPLLTILIPTKDRYHTLLPLCRYLESKKGDFEVIISDNSIDNSEHIKQLSELSSKFVYLHTSKKLSMRENCENGLKYANGKYITMLGDDDGIIIGTSLECISFLEKNNLDYALSPACKYMWPNLQTRLFGKKNYGILRDCDYLTDIIRVNSAVELRKVASNGASKIDNLPRFYQGIVKTKYLKDSLKKYGSIFLASMPDMSSSALLATQTEYGVKYNKPFIVNGVSSKSGGGLGAAGKHKGKLENGYGLSKIDLSEWPTQVPRFWSGGTVWASSFYITLSKIKGVETAPFNESALLAYCLVFHPKLLLNTDIGFFKRNLTISCVKHIYKQLKKRVIALFSNLCFFIFHPDSKDNNINNIFDALIHIEKRMSENR